MAEQPRIDGYETYEHTVKRHNEVDKMYHIYHYSHSCYDHISYLHRYHDLRHDM